VELAVAVVAVVAVVVVVEEGSETTFISGLIWVKWRKNR
jgi:hypothetical protein